MSAYVTTSCDLDLANPSIERISIIPVVKGTTEETTFIGLVCNRRAMITSIGGGIEHGDATDGEKISDLNAGTALLREIREEIGNYLPIDWDAPNNWPVIVNGESYTLIPELDRIPEEEFIPTSEIIDFMWVTHAEARRLYELQLNRNEYYSKICFGKFLEAIFPTFLDLDLKEVPCNKCVLDFTTPFREMPPNDEIRSTEEFFEILKYNPLHFHDRIIFYYSRDFGAFLFTDGERMYSVMDTRENRLFLRRFDNSRRHRDAVFFTMSDESYQLPEPARRNDVPLFRVGWLDRYHGNADVRKELKEYRATIAGLVSPNKTARRRLQAMIDFEKHVYDNIAAKRINPNDVERLKFMKAYTQMLRERQGQSIVTGEEVEFLTGHGLI